MENIEKLCQSYRLGKLKGEPEIVTNALMDVIPLVAAKCFDGMLGWLEYSIKRALGMEGTDVKDRQEGTQQAKGTIWELKKYEKQMEQLKEEIEAWNNI